MNKWQYFRCKSVFIKWLSAGKTARYIFKSMLSFIISIVMTFSAKAQISISGPTCVTAGTSYNYTISGNWTPSTYMSWCITGGVLTGTTNTCESGTPVPYITVTWSNSTSGSVSLTTSNPGGNASKTVNIAMALNSGTLTSGKTQNITYNTVPPTAFNCPVATGGYCTPTYAYQWQQSTDNVNYTDISGATGLNYAVTTQLIQTTYYRRKVTETNSSTVGYSDVATVFVFPQLFGGSVSGSSTINYNTQPATFTSTQPATGGNCSGSYSYLWQQSTDNITFTDMGLFTSTAFASGPLITTTYFRRKVTCGSETAYSNTLTITVNPALSAGTIAQNVINISSGSSPGVLVADPASGGACGNSFNYQWQSAAPLGTYADIPGANGLDYTPGNLTTSTNYRKKVTCGTDIEYSNVCQVIVGTPVSILNYMRVRDITKPGVITDAASAALTNPNDVKQSTQYFDGLGRITQIVAMQASPLLKDIVDIDMYDMAGRETVKYLPYVSISSIDGNNKSYPVTDLLSFNSGQFAGEQFYLAHSNMEASSLNRPVASYSPGVNWVGSRRGTSSLIKVNGTEDSVRIWYINPLAGSLPTSTTMYASGQLMLSVNTDEGGHQVIEYKDKEGNIILKKVQLANSPGTAHVGWLCTYYVYDDLNNLRFVIPPLAVQLINSNWTITTGIANELCFRYEYDSRKRMFIKKIPGSGEVWMIYDTRDRLAMTQDSALRFQHKWLFTKYDSQNRPDSIGLITDNTNYNNRSYHQNIANSSINYPVVSSYTNELLTQTYYDDYSWASAAGLPSAMATSIAGNSTYFITSYNVSPVYAVNPVPLYITRGMVTGVKTEVLGSNGSQYLYGVKFYDDRGREVQSQSINYTGGIDTLTSQYDFSGKPLRMLAAQKKNGTNAQAH